MEIPTRGDLVVDFNGATPADRSMEKRRLRKHSVLNVIRRHGPLSRADITKKSGFNLPSVSTLVDELVADGLVLEEEAKAVPRGRRPIPVYLNVDAASIVGLDIGKRSTIMVVINLGGKLLTRYECKTPALKKSQAYADWARKVMEKVFREHPPSAPLSGIGVAIPGMNSHPDHLSPAEMIRKALTDRFGVPTLVEQDGRMMALGSHWFGAGRDLANFLVINLGHGTGMGVFIDGRLYRGKGGFAGEIGYIPIGDEDIDGYADCPSAMENMASGAGLIRRARARGLEVDDVSQLAEMARGGDRRALKAFKDFAQRLARGIATVANLFDPEAIILSGRVCRSADLFLEDLRAETARHTLGPIMQSTPIILSNLDVDLGPMGAAAAILHQIFNSSHVQVDEVI